MKRFFGGLEAAFDVLYLAAALVIGAALLLTAQGDGTRMLAGVMALVLGGGDAFHLVPRIKVIRTRQEDTLRPALGRGKQVTSVTMTVFYLLLWQIGVQQFAPAHSAGWTFAVYLLAAVRIALCFAPQNRWQERYPPLKWAVYRNIPFFLLGAVVAGQYFAHRSMAGGLGWMWLAILLSFACYLPVVLWSNRSPKVGMLMLPKTCAYLWMLLMCLSL